MSLILDALNRSRSEQGEVPNIQTVHANDAGTASPDRRALGLGAALIVALVVIAWLLLGRSAEETAPVASSVPTTAVPAEKPVAPTPQPEAAKVAPSKPEAVTRAPVAPPTSREASKPSPVAPAKKPATRSDAAVSALYDETAPEEVVAPPPAVPTSKKAVIKPVEPEEREPVAADKTPARSKPAAEEEVLDIEQIIQRAESELEDARLAEHPSPFISSLSQQTKDNIPTLIYERHDYSGTPGKSRVVLNGATLGAGGNSRGVKVEEILPDSVVLNYQGTSFRLRALNSWVNL